MDVRLRPITGEDADVGFLCEMLREAACWRDDMPSRTVEDVLADPQLALYVRDWGRSGDAGVVAIDVAGRRLGAAWYRRFTDEEHGYGFIDATTPELTVAVVSDARSRGVGTALLRALIERAHEDALPAVSLSVEDDNPALRLYERLGFARVVRVGNVWTMRLALR